MFPRVIVPASSANLGPGYDAFGLALALYDTFEAEPAGEWRVDVRGEGEGELNADERNEVVRAILRVFDVVGHPDVPAAHVRCDNGIPVGRGLGSSSAAIVGGLMLGQSLAGVSLGHDRLLQLASELEGHPDNVAAALAGGFTVCWDDGYGQHAERIEPGAGLAAVAVVSDAALATREARRALPATVPHADAAASAGCAGLLAAGIALGRAELIAAGAHDLLHEPYREHLYPDVTGVKASLLQAGADAAVLSGAGPTVIGLVTDIDDGAALARASEVAARFEGRALPGRRAMALAIDRRGATLG